MFMKKEKLTLEEANEKIEAVATDMNNIPYTEDTEAYEAELQAREEAEFAAENIDSVLEPNENDEVVADVIVDDADLMEPTEEEKKEISEPSASDPDYLEYASEAVGYENRQIQWDTYHTILNYIPSGDSIIDFGAGRGDFERFVDTEYPDHDLDYVGIEMNQQLVDASKKAYNDEVDIRCMDWLKLPKELQEDWCINIGSNNLRYDGDTTTNDESYLYNTIDIMMTHSNKGSIILLASDILATDDGLINWNAGNILNWAQKKYGSAAVDHSMSNDLFILIIYKNEK